MNETVTNRSRIRIVQKKFVFCLDGLCSLAQSMDVGTAFFSKTDNHKFLSFFSFGNFFSITNFINMVPLINERYMINTFFV
jgi:hypothetical protein